LPVNSGELREKPTIAPDIAAEILSPDDRASLFHEKIALYLAFGTRLVIVVDPEKRRVDFHERGTVRRFTADDVARSDVYVDLAIDLPKLFAGI
jgi:Uma2 family endonuclease